MPFEAPNPLLGASILGCHDKANFAYQNPCSANNNYVLGFTNHPNHNPSEHPDGQPGDFIPRQCWNNHNAQYGVCRYCIAAIEDQRWFKTDRGYITRRPIAASPLGRSRSRHYLTRLCRLCEQREEELLRQIQHISQFPPSLGSLPTQVEQDRMLHYPDKRCNCTAPLDQGIRCLRDRRGHWAIRKRTQLRTKATNKAFLERLAFDATLGQAVVASRDQRASRMENGTSRACRCGREPVASIAQATVMQCMACEGIVHFAPPGNHNAGGGPLPIALRQNTYTSPALFQLGPGRQVQPATGINQVKDRAYWTRALR